MKNIQFNFSVLVALTLMTLGLIILQESQAGVGLMVTGAFLLVISLLTKKSTEALLSHSIEDK